MLKRLLAETSNPVRMAIDPCRVGGLVHFVLLSLLVGLMPVQAGATDAPPEVLILVSYHPGEAWSDRELAGIQQTLRQTYPELLPAIEYLDAKRFPESGHLERLKGYLAQKYQSRSPDLIIALDDSALELLLDDSAELFAGVPVVFGGINDDRPERLSKRPNMTGVAQTHDLADGLELLLRLHPETRRLWVIHDHTNTGRAMGQEITRLIPRLQGRVQIEFAPDVPFDELRRQLAALTGDSLVLLLSYAVDGTEKSLERADIVRLISSTKPVPVYATHELLLGHGILGGLLLDGYRHGAQVAALARRVLDGEMPERISVEPSQLQPAFDARQLQRFGIQLADLPPDSLVINQPLSFYTLHRVWVWSALVGLILLALVILALASALVRIHQAKRLSAANAERLRLATLASNDVIWDWDILEDSQHWNESGERIFGWTEPVVGRVSAAWWLERVHPEDRRRVSDGFDAVVQSVDTDYWRDEYRFRRQDGDYAEVMDRGYVMRDAQGRAMRMIGAMLDMTERRRIEEQTRQQRAFYESILERVQDGIWVGDAEHRIIYVNPAMARIAGVPVDHLLEHWVLEDFSAETLLEFRPLYLEVMASLIPREYEIHLVTPSGRECWQSGWLIPMVDGGTFAGMIGTARDVTDIHAQDVERRAYQAELEDIAEIRTLSLRRTEEHLRLILESSASGLYGLDRDGHITFANPAVSHILGYPPEQLYGRVSHTLFHHRYPDGRDYPLQECPTRFVLEQGRKISVDNEVFWHADGRPIPVIYSIQPMIRDDEILGAVVSFIDITTQKQAEAAREAALAEAERLSQVKACSWPT
jgi:PAS domain S-box-containing protein